MADSKITIDIEANAEGAKQALESLENATASAMERGAKSANKLSKSLDGVAQSAKISAREMKGVVAGMASMAAGVAATALKANGRDMEASYLTGASAGAVQGAGMLAPLGPLAMLLGALGGGGLGALRNYFDRQGQGREQSAAEMAGADALEAARLELERIEARSASFAKTLETLGDETRAVDVREAERAREIKRREEMVADARQRQIDAEERIRRNAAALDGPMTKAQQDAARALREEWQKAGKDMAEAKAELESLRDATIEEAEAAAESVKAKEKEGPIDRSNPFGSADYAAQKLGWNLFGGMNNPLENLERQSLDIGKQQLAVLREIARRDNAAVWSA